MKNLKLQRFYWIVGSILFILILAACVLPSAGAKTLAVVTNETPTAVTGPTRSTTGNWSGYQVKGNTFTSVEATWQVPTVTCPASNAHVSIWVGLSSKTLEQDGTDGICNGSTVSYHAWWEMFAGHPGSKSGTFFTVSPGDIVFSSVYVINGMYAMQVTDETSGATSYTLQPCNVVCENDTAEWIVEVPGGGTQWPLANYSTVTILGATAGTGSMTGGISAYEDKEINMEQKGVQMSVPTDLAAGSEGTMFTVTWHADQ